MQLIHLLTFAILATSSLATEPSSTFSNKPTTSTSALSTATTTTHGSLTTSYTSKHHSSRSRSQSPVWTTFTNTHTLPITKTITAWTRTFNQAVETIPATTVSVPSVKLVEHKKGNATGLIFKTVSNGGNRTIAAKTKKISGYTKTYAAATATLKPNETAVLHYTGGAGRATIAKAGLLIVGALALFL